MRHIVVGVLYYVQLNIRMAGLRITGAAFPAAVALAGTAQ